MSHDRAMPPSDWPGLEMVGMTKLNDDIYFGWLANEPNPTFWHWCAALEDVPAERKVHEGCWIAAGTSQHQLVSREPLHLEPSLLWKCCGLHGFVRDGEWVSA
ncbi:hypothetical protein [Streptomyces pseudovenezuelae]|uniref:hypothetical protein n=1 Tax=Streptomyces pseudovenezuelae TaxID=67350 RepID=UPI002E8220E6|nr:hypothetical protein [Streptomyces pseudovenezuelae]WUA94449.1 hypothetical protein OHO81_45230 [Streptomyces pseudovenezuelae]